MVRTDQVLHSSDFHLFSNSRSLRRHSWGTRGSLFRSRPVFSSRHRRRLWPPGWRPRPGTETTDSPSCPGFQPAIAPQDRHASASSPKHDGLADQRLAEDGRGVPGIRQARLEPLLGFPILVLMEGCRKGNGICFHGVRRGVTHRDGFGEKVGGERFRQHAVSELAAEVQQREPAFAALRCRKSIQIRLPSETPSRLSNGKRSFTPFAMEKTMKNPEKAVIGKGNKSTTIAERKLAAGPPNNIATPRQASLSATAGTSSATPFTCTWSSIERQAERSNEQERADPHRPETKTHAQAHDNMPKLVNGNHRVIRAKPETPRMTIPISCPLSQNPLGS